MKKLLLLINIIKILIDILSKITAPARHHTEITTMYCSYSLSCQLSVCYQDQICVLSDVRKIRFDQIKYMTAPARHVQII